MAAIRRAGSLHLAAVAGGRSRSGGVARDGRGSVRHGGWSDRRGLGGPFRSDRIPWGHAGWAVADADRGCWRRAVSDGRGGSECEGGGALIHGRMRAVPGQPRRGSRDAPNHLVLGHWNQSRQHARCEEGRTVQRHMARKSDRPLPQRDRSSTVRDSRERFRVIHRTTSGGASPPGRPAGLRRTRLGL
jgi:hypothetical protein